MAVRSFGAATVLIFACAAAACGSRAPDSVYIKASNPGAYASFGIVVALSSDGSTLAIGAPGESSSATGIDGDLVGDNAARRIADDVARTATRCDLSRAVPLIVRRPATPS